MDIQTYPSSFAVAILDAAASKGVDRACIIRKAGVSEEILNAEQGRIRAKTLQEITQHIALSLNDETLGFMKDPIRVGSFRMMCLACLGAPDLRAAIKRSGEFYRLLGANITGRFSENAGKVHWTIDSGYGVYDPKNYMIPAFMGAMYRWMSWMIDQKIVLDEVCFVSPQVDIASDFYALFSSSVQFSKAENSLSFDASYLDKRLVQNETSLRAFLSGGNSGLLSHPKDTSSLKYRVQRLMREDDTGRFFDIEELAGRMHTTPETLRRKLKCEGTNFKALKDGLRRDEAIYLLSRGDCSIESVAERVGFSDATAFFRAFKRWTGGTPRSYFKQDSA